jgi:predicted DNA-binding protein (MmcQ/YjbR family)
MAQGRIPQLSPARRAGRKDAIGAAELRDLCLGFPGSSETFPFAPETSVFKVAGKMFALSRLEEHPLRVSLKCEPLVAEQLRAAHPSVLPGYHLNKRHWNTVILNSPIPAQMLRDMIEDSYDLVVNKLPLSRRQALGWQPGQDLSRRMGYLSNSGWASSLQMRPRCPGGRRGPIASGGLAPEVAYRGPG